MHIIQAFLLWLFVSGLMVGGALAFHRLFPLESPWFGFVVPPLTFVILINFIEHFIALPNLQLLLPLLAGGLIWLIAKSPKSNISWKELRLPITVFLVSFAFTYGIRCLQPDILYTSDGMSDMNKINNYSQGDTLPPTDTWLAPYKFQWYYAMQHYAASLIKRLFDLKIGVAYNVSHALLSSLTCVVAAAAAFRISGGKTWITLVVPFLVEASATGSSAYIQLFMHNPSLWYASNPSGGVIDYETALKAGQHDFDNPLWQFLAHNPYRERLELQVPGYWTWREEYHPNSAGHFLTLLSVFSVAELAFQRRAIWPWVVTALIPFWAVVASTWALPLTMLICGGMIGIALYLGRRPAQLGTTLLYLLAGFILLWPSFYDVSSSPIVPDIIPTKPEWATPWREFLVQWWPVILLWVYGCFYFRELSPTARWILVVVPIMLIGLEFRTIEGRYNTIEKMWGYTYGVGFFALFPFVAARAGVACRILTIVLILSGTISLSGWLRNAWNWTPFGPWHDAEFQMEGTHYMTVDPQKKKILHTLSQVKHQTFLTGKCVDFNYYESPAPAVFTENRSYATWTYFESVANYQEEAERREKLNNAFYDGSMTNRLRFLQQNNITGIIIWPDNNLSNDYLDALTKEIESTYEYVDCKEGGDKNAGVYLRRPLPGQ